MQELSVQDKRYRNPFVRVLFMVVLYLLFIIVRTLLLLVAVVQFLAHLFTGKPTEVGLRWGRGMSGWLHQMMLFMTYNSEVMPFPFSALGAQDED